MTMDLDRMRVALTADPAELERGFRRAEQAAAEAGRALTRHVQGIDAATARMAQGTRTALRSVAAEVTALGALVTGGALSAQRIVEYADAWTNTTNQLVQTVRSHKDLLAVQTSVFALAQQNRTEYGGLVTLFTKASQAQKDLGASQGQILKFTDAVAKSLALSGTNATAAQGALLQLGQLLGQPRVMAEELNSIMEGTPRLAKAAAEGIAEAGGSVAKLKQLVIDGKVSNVSFFNAVLSQLTTLQAEFAKATPTVAQAVTVLDNALGKYIGETDQAAGASTALARGIIALSGELETVAAVAAAAGATIGTVFVARGLGPLAAQAALATGGVMKLATHVVNAEILMARGATAADAYAQGTMLASRAAQVQAAAELDAAKALQTRARADLAARQIQVAAAHDLDGAIGRTERIVTAERALESARTARAAADARVVVAEAAHAAALERTTFAARAAAVGEKALGGLRAAGASLVGALGGPWGAALVAGAAGFALVASSSSEAEAATEAYAAAQTAAAGVTRAGAADVGALATQYAGLSGQMRAVTQLRIEEALERQRDAVKALRLEAEKATSTSKPFAITATNGDGSEWAYAFERMGLAAQQVDTLRAALERFRASKWDDPAALGAFVQTLDGVGRAAGDAGKPILELARRLADPAAKAEELTRTAAELSARLILLRDPANAAARALLAAGTAGTTAGEGLAAAGTGAATATGDYQKLVAKLTEMRDTFAMSAAAAKAFEDGQNATPLQRAHTAALVAEVEALEKYKEALKDGDAAKADSIRETMATLVAAEASAVRQLVIAEELQKAAAGVAAGTMTMAAAREMAARAGDAAATETWLKSWQRVQETLGRIKAEVKPKKDGFNAGTDLKDFRAETEATVASLDRLSAAYAKGTAAVEEANRQQEIEQRLLKLGEKSRAEVTRLVNAEADARKRLDIAKWTAEQNRHIASAQALAAAERAGGEAVADANIQAKVAEELAKLNVAAGTEEARVIEAKVRALEGLVRQQRAAAEIRDAQDDLTYARAELALMGQSEGVRERALKTLKLQQEASKKAAELGADAAAEWLKYQEQIADTEAMTAYAKKVEDTAREISSDLSDYLVRGLTEGFEGGFDGVLDLAKRYATKIAATFLEQHLFMPITTQVVGAAPGLFGISAPSGGSVAASAVGQAAAGQSPGGSLLNAGTTVAGRLIPSSWTNSLVGRLDAWGASTLGLSAASTTTTMGAVTGGAAYSVGGAGVMAMPGGMTNAVATGAMGPGLAPVSATAAAPGMTLSGILGGAGIGFAGGMLGGMLGNATGSKAVGGLSGAAMGGLGTWALMGSSAGPIGIAAGAIVGGIMGILGTGSKPSNREGGVHFNLETGKSRVGGQTGKKYSAENQKQADDIAKQVYSLYGALSNYAGGRELTKDFYIGVGDRDGIRAQYDGPSRERTFSRDEAGVRDMVAWFLQMWAKELKDGMDPVVAKAVDNIDWSDAEKAIKQLDIAANFADTVKAMSNNLGLEDTARKSAKEAARQDTKALTEWLDTIKELFPSTTTGGSTRTETTREQVNMSAAEAIAKGLLTREQNYLGDSTYEAVYRDISGQIVSVGEDLAATVTVWKEATRTITEGGQTVKSAELQQAEAAAKAYVDNIVNAVDPKRYSDVEAAAASFAARIEELGPLLKAAGYTDAELPALKAQATANHQAKYRRQYTATQQQRMLAAGGVDLSAGTAAGAAYATELRDVLALWGEGADRTAALNRGLTTLNRTLLTAAGIAQPVSAMSVSVADFTSTLNLSSRAVGPVTAALTAMQSAASRGQDVQTTFAATVSTLTDELHRGNIDGDQYAAMLGRVTAQLREAVSVANAVRQGGAAVRATIDPAYRASVADVVADIGVTGAALRPVTDTLTLFADRARTGAVTVAMMTDALGTFDRLLRDGAITTEQYGALIGQLTGQFQASRAVEDARRAGTIAIRGAADPGYRPDTDARLAALGMAPAAIDALRATFDRVAQAADNGRRSTGDLQAAYDALTARLDAGTITVQQHQQATALLTEDYARAVQVEARALEQARARRAFNGDLLTRRQSALGDSRGAALTRFDLDAAAAIEAAVQAGQDVAALRLQLAADRALLDFQQAQQTQLDAIDREVDQRERSTQSLRDGILAQAELAKSFRDAYDSIRLGEDSDLAPGQRLDEVRRKFAEAVAAYRAATTTDAKQRHASEITALGSQRIALAKENFGTADGSDRAAVLSVLDELGTIDQAAVTAAERTVELNEQQVRALQDTRRSIETMNRPVVAGLDALNAQTASAYAALQTNLTALRNAPAPQVNVTVSGTSVTTSTGGVSTVLTPAQRYLQAYADVAAAGVDAAQHYALFGAREGRERFGLSLSRDQEYLVRYPDVAAAVARGDYATGRDHYDRFGRSEGRQYAAGGLVTGGPPGVDTVRAWLTNGERVLSVPHAQMLESIYRMARVANDRVPAPVTDLIDFVPPEERMRGRGFGDARPVVDALDRLAGQVAGLRADIGAHTGADQRQRAAIGSDTVGGIEALAGEVARLSRVVNGGR